MAPIVAQILAARERVLQDWNAIRHLDFEAEAETERKGEG